MIAAMGEEETQTSTRRRLKQDSSDDDEQSSKRNKKEKSSDEDENENSEEDETSEEDENSEAEESDDDFEPEEDEGWKDQKSNKGKGKHKKDCKINTGSKDQKGTEPGRRKGRSTNVDGEFEMEVVGSKRAAKVRINFRSTLYPSMPFHSRSVRGLLDKFDMLVNAMRMGRLE
jgi:hypothetical protein